MEENEINFFYQYNSQNEIINTQLLTDIYFLKEYFLNSRDSLTYDKMISLLKEDGVDFDKVKTIYIVDYQSDTKKVLKTLSKGNFNDYNDNNDIYLHFLLDENLTSQKNKYNRAKEIYKNKIEKFEEEYKTSLEEVKNMKNSNRLSDNSIYDIIKKMEEKKNLLNSQLRSSLNKENSKKDIYILYLFCSVFDLKTVNFEENEYYEEIKYIYNLFNETPNISAKLVFEPLINMKNFNFQDYLEQTPDIIHININSNYLNQEIEYKNFSETINIKFETILEKLGSQKKISDVKLLILSSDKDKKIQEYFKTIKKIIYPSDLKKQKNENKTFYQEFYTNLLKGFSIDQSFAKAYHFNYDIKSDKQEIYIHQIKKGEKQKNKNDIEININCSLNLDFVKYNYHQILGRNNQIKNCIDKINEKENNILIYGALGAGKKSLVQIVGKHFYERNHFNIIEYIEIYDLLELEEILQHKIKRVKKILSENNNEKEKVLLILNFNFLFDEKNKIGNIEKIINSYKDNNKNITFIYICTFDIKENEKWKIISNKNSIKIEVLKKKKDVPILLNSIVEEFLEQKTKNDFLKLKNVSEYPSFFFLQALYFKKFNEVKIIINNNLINIELQKQLLSDFITKAKDEFKLKKILPMFYILKLGIREDIFHLFFGEKEIDIIKNNLKYLIRFEGDSNGNNYLMDGYFKYLLEKIYQEDNNLPKDFYKNNLLKIIENYSKIFRYIINFEDFPYDLSKEFHAGINQGIWFDLYDNIFKGKYERFCEKNMGKKIYFDDMRYFYNIKNIFENKEYMSIIKRNVEDFKEYISQIIICVPTILYFIHNNHLLKKILSIFEELLANLQSDKNIWNKDIIRFKIFKYWISGESHDYKDINKQLEEEDNFTDEIKFEINLIEIYYNIKEKIEIESIKSFEQCKKLAKNNELNLIRLNILYGKATNYEDKNYFIDANNSAQNLINNKYIKKVTLLELAQFYLNQSLFDEFNKCVLQYETNNGKIKDKLENKLVDKFDTRFRELIEEKDKKYKNYIKNKLFFYTSEPFFDDKEDELNPLKTELNNTFYFKNNLELKLPKDMEIFFDFIQSNFLEELEKKFQNPLKFIYIGSDHYNNNGDIFYSDENNKARAISMNDLEKKIKQFKNKPELIILGFINSEIIAQYFKDNNYPNVVYLRKSDKLIHILNTRPYVYFYFQRCFFNFIINFLLDLDKKTIEKALNDLEDEFQLELMELQTLDEDLGNDIESIFQEGPLIDCYTSNDIILFEELSISRQNSMNNNNINIIIDEAKYDQYEDDNNIINDFELIPSEKKAGNKNDNNNNGINLNFYSTLNENVLEYLLKKRYYGNKKLLNDIILKLKLKKIINIFGPSQTGKSTLVIELCKYFFMRKYFKKGIYYISNYYNKNWEKQLKDLKIKQKNSKLSLTFTKFCSII